MERLSVPTRFGEIWLGVEPPEVGDQRPVLLAISGAFAGATQVFGGLAASVPEAAVVLAPLPGTDCPGPQVPSIGTFAAALTEAVDSAFPGRRLAICGDSAGGLVALAMHADARLVIDPPLVTGNLWPLVPVFARMWVERPTQRDFIRNVFGWSPDGVEARDYTHLLGRSARVLVGAMPLAPEREVDEMPSLVGQAERDLMLTLPHIHLTVMPGGHRLLRRDRTGPVLAILRQMLGQ